MTQAKVKIFKIASRSMRQRLHPPPSRKPSLESLEDRAREMQPSAMLGAAGRACTQWLGMPFEFTRDFDASRPSHCDASCRTLVLRYMGAQRLLELAAGLSLGKALSIVSGHPMAWNLSVETDGVIAHVGPFAIGWNRPMDFEVEIVPIMVCALDVRSGSNIAFIQCTEVSSTEVENEAIRLATEALVAACRKEAKKGPRFKEVPLADCAVVMLRFFEFDPAEPNLDQLAIADFDDLGRGRLLELARRAFRQINIV